MEVTTRPAGRKTLTIVITLIVLALAVFFFGLWLSSRPQEIEWSVENLSSWIDSQVQDEADSAQCLLTGGTDTASEVRHYFDNARWQEDDLEYYLQTSDSIRDYQLSDIAYTLEEKSDAFLLNATFTYDSFSFSTADAPLLEDAVEVLLYVAQNINADGNPVVFSYSADNLSDDTLSCCIFQAVSNNTAYGTDDLRFNYTSFPDSEGTFSYLYLTTFFTYADASPDYTRQAMAALDGLEAQVRALSPATEEETYRAIEQVVCDTLEYDYDLADITTANADNPDAFTAEELARRGLYGAAVLHKTVCSGYAVTYQALCQRLGVACWQIPGTNNGTNHVWNMISLDGVRTFVDCTFLDTGDWLDDFFTEDEYAERGYVAEADTIYPW